jgi:hypothetical protein
MLPVHEVKRWLETLEADGYVAIDDGGLTLVQIDGEAWLEVGGIPDDEES